MNGITTKAVISIVRRHWNSRHRFADEVSADVPKTKGPFMKIDAGAIVSGMGHSNDHQSMVA